MSWDKDYQWIDTINDIENIAIHRKDKILDIIRHN